MQEMQETWAWSPGWEDPLEKEINPLQYSCLENPRDRGAWQAIVHGVLRVRVGNDLATEHTHLSFRESWKSCWRQVVWAGSRPPNQGPSRALWPLTSGRTMFLCSLEMPLCVLILTDISPPAPGDSILSPVLTLPSCLGISAHLYDSTPLHWGGWKRRCS